jgi:hypothetical protein
MEFIIYRNDSSDKNREYRNYLIETILKNSPRLYDFMYLNQLDQHELDNILNSLMMKMCPLRSA